MHARSWTLSMALSAVALAASITVASANTIQHIAFMASDPQCLQQQPTPSCNVKGPVEIDRATGSEAPVPPKDKPMPGPALAPVLPEGAPYTSGVKEGFTESAASSSGTADASDWPSYRNEEYGFELRVPSHLAVVPTGGAPQPAPVFRVWFQDASLLGSPLASMQPPQLAIDIYDNVNQQNLAEWLASEGMVTNLAQAATEPSYVGALEGLRLTDPRRLAPNVFYFVARGALIYRFTPLSNFADGMLASVTFFP